MRWRPAASLVLLAAMSAWGLWLLSEAKGTADYVLADAAALSRAPSCEWTPIGGPSVASLGFSHDAGHAWSDRETAYLALPIPAVPAGGWLDIDVPAVAKGRVLVEVAGGDAQYAVTEAGLVRVPVPEASRPGTILVTFVSEDMLPPQGQDRRWLGLAISRLRICPAG